MLEGSFQYEQVPRLMDADFIFLAGVYNTFAEDTTEYKNMLAEAIERNLPMVCANADTSVNLAGKICICPGTVAAEYSTMGGLVYNHGKPNIEMFSESLAVAQKRIGKNIDKVRCIMVGDSLTTDIKGAFDFGIDSLLYLRGVLSFTIEAASSNEEIVKILKTKSSVLPTYILR
jgi:ribonucleotide monophosphatase NagD (HAD superfamily)